jgi:hypothetical protein
VCDTIVALAPQNLTPEIVMRERQSKSQPYGSRRATSSQVTSRPTLVAETKTNIPKGTWREFIGIDELPSTLAFKIFVLSKYWY